METPPRLMFVSKVPIDSVHLRRLRELFEAAHAGDPGRWLVIEPGFDVYQLVGGAWVPVLTGPGLRVRVARLWGQVRDALRRRRKN